MRWIVCWILDAGDLARCAQETKNYLEYSLEDWRAITPFISEVI